MFILLTQLASGDPIAIDVSNIREFHPEVIDGKEGPVSGTLIHLYRGEAAWIVRENVHDVFTACNTARGAI